MHKATPYHPILAAAAPVLLLLSANAGVAPPTSALRAVAVAVAFVIVLWAVLALALRSIDRAAAPTTVLVLFGAILMPVHRAVIGLPWIDTFSQRLVAGGFIAAIGLLIVALVIRHILVRSNPPAVNGVLNLLLLCVVVVPVANIAWVSLSDTGETGLVSPPPTDTSQVKHRPDVYYLIPDSYGRADVLEETYGYDNSGFLRQLEDLGFIVADESTSNYAHSALSIPSSLNMSFITPPGGKLRAADYFAPRHALLGNAVMRAFSEAGYVTVAHSSGYSLTEITTAEIYRGRFAINEFEHIAGSTFLHPRLWRYLSTRLPGAASKYARVTSTLADLGDERRRSEPVFVFAHFLAPHTPYEFNRDGTRRGARDDAASSHESAYITEVQGLNTHLLEAVRGILAASDDPPVIIIQSDHGPGGRVDWSDLQRSDDWQNVDVDDADIRARMCILNAYLVPEEMRGALYPEISPVNTFRLILNYCLDADIPLVEDRAFFSTWGGDYDFEDVTDLVREDDDGQAFAAQ
ncbi:MAG: sulfatase-like hydrolase/transferase [Armatimonadota bacterium]